MSDILERLKGYGPPDRVLDEHRSISVDIHAAADEITQLRAEAERLSEKLTELQDRAVDLVSFVKGNSYPLPGSLEFCKLAELLSRTEAALRRQLNMPNGVWCEQALAQKEAK